MVVFTCCMIIFIAILEILLPSLGFVLPVIAIGLDLYIGFIIIRWIVEKIEKHERRRKKKKRGRHEEGA